MAFPGLWAHFQVCIFFHHFTLFYKNALQHQLTLSTLFSSPLSTAHLQTPVISLETCTMSMSLCTLIIMQIANFPGELSFFYIWQNSKILWFFQDWKTCCHFLGFLDAVGTLSTNLNSNIHASKTGSRHLILIIPMLRLLTTGWNRTPLFNIPRIKKWKKHS